MLIGRITVRKLKWDGSESAIVRAVPLVVEPLVVAWLLPAGSRRARPRKGVVDVLTRDEVSVWTGGWWVATAVRDRYGVTRHKVDAATPLRRPRVHTFVWTDLDLDLVHDTRSQIVRLKDRLDFARNAALMDYPSSVRRGAWSGIEEAEELIRTRAWPFDGWLEESLREAGSRSAALAAG